MPLTPEQKQELAEMRRLDELEAKFGPKLNGAQPNPEHARRDAPAQAALEGFGETATMGYLPHMQAGAERGVDGLSRLLGVGPAAEDAKLREQGFKVPERSYLQARDENIQRQKELTRDNPYASFAGKAAGVGAGLLVPGQAAAKGASALAQIGRGAAVGALQGAAYNPGDEKGKIDLIQAGPRAKNAALGGVIGGGMAAVGAGISKLADKSRMVGKVKDSANLSKSVKEEIDAANAGVSSKYIQPRADKLKELLQGQSVEVNPERLKGVSRGLDDLSERMSRRVGENGRASIPASRAQRMKQVLDARANYSQSKPFDMTSVAKGEKAKAAADLLRGKLSDVHPDVSGLNSEMSEALRLRGALSKSSASAPISSIKGAPGTDKGSLIDAIDKMSGSKLEKLSNDIEGAKDLLLDPSNLVKPLQLPNELRKMAIRSTAAGARGVDAVTPAGTKEALARALMEAKRVK